MRVTNEMLHNLATTIAHNAGIVFSVINKGNAIVTVDINKGSHVNGNAWGCVINARLDTGEKLHGQRLHGVNAKELYKAMDSFNDAMVTVKYQVWDKADRDAGNN